MEQQLHDASSRCEALSSSNKQLEQQNQTLAEQKAAFEEESAFLHTLASRHKEERVSLENDKQNLNALNQELTRKAEVGSAQSAAVGLLHSRILLLASLHSCC